MCGIKNAVLSFVTIKEHVNQCNSVTHKTHVFNSFWTIMELCGTHLAPCQHDAFIVVRLFKGFVDKSKNTGYDHTDLSLKKTLCDSSV